MIQSKLRMHAYAGRENGLMIIGTRDELRQFAKDLADSLERDNPPPDPGWPAGLVAIDSPSPYAAHDFEVSFHLQTQPLPAALDKPLNRASSAYFYLVVFLLALLGIASLPLWAQMIVSVTPCVSALNQCDSPGQ
jgi:hypothetical protein